MKHIYRIFLTILALGTTVVAAADVVWYDGKSPVTYQVQGKVSPVVEQALQMFVEDMELVTTHQAVSDKHAPIRIVQGRGADDGFCIRVQDGQVVVEGHNARGTAYGILELSRMAGVSPWVWWGDVRPHSRFLPLSLPDTFRLEHTPSVEYRGIFINDEDWSLRPWSKDNMGPQTYKRLFQLMLRLRANTLWPAMHPGTPAFFTVAGNKEMADSFGIVIGTSHCEPLLRNNVAEWDAEQRGPYNYITNREQVQNYWVERLKEVVSSGQRPTVDDQRAMFTLGMRGIHDGSMEGVSGPEEKLSALQQVIDDQRELIKKHYLSKLRKTGSNHQSTGLEQVPQVFIPYKEVLEIMESGLRVPDDVTLMWCDDNYGYLTRLPDAEQQKRKGGGGVYYHLSYWGRPHDYLWLSTTQPGLIYEEMRTAYDHNCRRLWIANVHDPKVAAYQLELFLDMAWNIDGVTPSTLDLYLEQWLCTQFGGLVGKAIAPAMRELYRLNAIRKPEFMGWTQVELDKKRYPGGKSVPGSTQFTLIEGYRRMEAFARIEATVDTWRPLVMDGRQDAYFAHVLYPVHAAAAMTRKMLSYETESLRAYEEIQQLTEHYNTMNDGKWQGLMSAAPRDLPVFGKVRTQFPQHPSVGRLIARNACDYSLSHPNGQTANPPNDQPTIIPMLGHSMNAVALPRGVTLTYEFDSPQDGEAQLYTAMIPTQPGDRGDLRYQVTVDNQEPVVISLKTPYRSEQWKQSVLRGQALTKTPVRLSKGPHKLHIQALDDHIIADQWMIDFCPDRAFYAIPVSKGT
ncbi:MAG: glycosyl hydrolase 115 family protein [Bacteroidales bacterium]|nr:glycosyl hydrolase 115 family protein [Bacteroidales bacterium]MBR6275834.1 glycosyl hydrolase 115 family protein [Prevotella sp.]